MSAQEMTVGTIRSRRNLYLAFATLTLLVLGLIYAWSIFAVPIGVTFEDYKPVLSQVFQVSMFAFCLSALVGAQIIRKFSAKAAIIVAAFLMVIGFVSTAQLAGLGVWALFLFYGIFSGSGCGIAYNAIISLVNPWFPDRIGFSSGVMMMGFGISSLVFGSLANALFGVMEWTVVFVLIALVTFVVMVILALVVKPAPANISSLLGISKVDAREKTSPTQQQFILTSRTFWLYSIWSTLIVACILTLIGTAAQGANSLQLDDTLFVGFGALLVGLVSTMNGVGRIINGIIFDKLGLLFVMLLSGVLCLACMIALSVSLSAHIGLLYVVAAICAAFPYSAVPVMSSAFSRQRFGSQNFSMNLGITNCSIAAAATVNIIIAAVLGSATGPNGPLIYGVLAVLAIIALLATLVFGKVYRADLKIIQEELSE